MGELALCFRPAREIESEAAKDCEYVVMAEDGREDGTGEGEGAEAG